MMNDEFQSSLSRWAIENITDNVLNYQLFAKALWLKPMPFVSDFFPADDADFRR